MTKRANFGSVPFKLMFMEVGDTVYIETTADKYQQTMRLCNPPRTRRLESMKDWALTTQLFTAVPACATAGGVRYLIGVTRVQ